MNSCLAVGLMSGTSMDGVDTCVLRITEPVLMGHGKSLKLELVGFSTIPYSTDLRDNLTTLCQSGSVAEVCRYNALLGRVFADAALKVVDQYGLNMEQVTLIGSHGQTVHHLPTPTLLHNYTFPSTLQLGDPSVIAQHCHVTTVGDFRAADMAVGGQGAPLITYLDEILLKRWFEDTGRVGLMLNLGGISNITALVPFRDTGSERTEFRLIGFDCGPGNVLIDLLMKKWFNKDFDKDGEMGLTGTISDELLRNLVMEDQFVCTRPPKSTGREYYGEQYLEQHLSQANALHITKKDIIATLSEFTALAVWQNYQLFIEPVLCRGTAASYNLFVSGGGARNKAIMRGLERQFKGFHVSTTSEVGIDPDAKEAMCFALLGYQTLKGRPASIPSVTGATKQVILGKICPVIRTDTLLNSVHDYNFVQ